MMPKRDCAVRGCKRTLLDIECTPCHRFPLEVEEAAKWVQFSQNPYAEHQFKLAGPVGVRKLFMCSLHFEPSCYKVQSGSKLTLLKNGALPTLNEASDEVDTAISTSNDASNEASAGDVGNIAGETMKDVEKIGDGVIESSRKRSKYRRASDRFFEFLMDDDNDDDDDDLDLDLRQVARHQTAARPLPAKRKAPTKHGQFCLCSRCRKDRAAMAMAKANTPNKTTQTEDRGPQPLASPVPVGTHQDSCRLCFSTDQLEPLCSGMIVVRDEMLDKIYVCTGVLIIPRPKESIFICTPCAQLINSFHSYRQQVCSNNRALLRVSTQKMPEAVTVRKIAPPLTPPIKKYSTAMKVTPAVRKAAAPLAPVVPPSRKIAPRAQLPFVQPEIPIDPLVEIKTEPEDPLEGCGEPAVKRPAKKIIQFPAPMMLEEVKTETDLFMEAEELPEEDSWKCWLCENSFLFQFECAKHMLMVHKESVACIKQRMNLDELNANMLEMMSVHQRK